MLVIRLEAIASRLETIATRLEAIAIRLEATASRLEAIATRLEAIASRLEGIATRLLFWRPSRLEAIATRLEAIASRFENLRVVTEKFLTLAICAVQVATLKEDHRRGVGTEQRMHPCSEAMRKTISSEHFAWCAKAADFTPGKVTESAWLVKGKKREKGLK